MAQIISWGALIYAFAVLAGPMAAELGWSKTETYLLASLALAMAGMASYPVGRAIDRGHGRAMMAGGSALAAISLGGWALSGSVWSLVPSFIGLGTAQAMTLYEPAFAIIARRQGEKARDGITSLTLWGGFASTFFIPITQMMLDRFGWRGALAGLGLCNLLICLPLHLWLLRPGADAACATVRNNMQLADAGAVGWAVRQWAFWGLALSFMLYFAAFTGLTFHLYPMLAERGMEASDIVIIMAIVGPAQVAGRILMAMVGRGVPIRRVGMATTLILTLSLLALIFMGSHVGLLAIFALIYGGANGVMTLVRGACVPEMLTRRAYGAINGLLTTPIALLRAAAPTLAALLWQASGGYGGVLTGFVAMAGLMTCVFWLVASRPPPRE